MFVAHARKFGAAILRQRISILRFPVHTLFVNAFLFSLARVRVTLAVILAGFINFPVDA